MDDKRILWVTAAVGIFLLVVIGAALILYSPHKSTEPLISSAQTDNSTWLLSSSSGSMQNSQDQTGQLLPSDIQSSGLQSTDNGLQNQTDMQNTNGVLPPETVQSRDVTVISENTTVIDLGASQTTAQNAPGDNQTNQTGAAEQRVISAPSGTQPMSDVKTVVPVTVQAEATTSAKTNNTAVSSSAAEAKKTSTTASTKKSNAGAQAKTQTKKAKPAVKNTISAKTASASAKSAKTGSQKIADRFWVQAASYTNKANAEYARSVLAGEKIPAEVFTYQDKAGTVYYRLRVGPYTTESEAEYWNSRIKLIDNFSSTKSYVTNSSKPAR